MLTQTWVTLVLILVVFATLVQIAGLVSPLWIYLETAGQTVGVGLFYRVGCEASSGDNCSALALNQLPFGYNTEATYNKDSWEAVVWLETIAASFGLLLSVLMVVYSLGFGVWKKMNNLNTAMVAIAICAWLPLVVGLIIYLVYYGKVITRSPDLSPQSFPWSPAMCLVAGVLFFIITFLIRLRCRNRNYVKNAIPTSTDSKMALNPSSKNQLVKRYFTPSPYREDRRQALYSSGFYNDQSQLLGSGSVGGTLERNGFDNRVSMASRAIEYNGADSRPETRQKEIIQTDGLSAGTYAVANNGRVSTMVGDDNLQGTIYERNLSSYVNRPSTAVTTAANYGTEVVERRFTTRTVAENSFGGQVNIAPGSPGRQPEIRSEVRSGFKSGYWQQQQQQQQQLQQQQQQRQQQWQGGLEQQEEFSQEEREARLLRSSVVLNRQKSYDAFSDIDAETVYYTGQEGFTPLTLRDGRPINSEVRHQMVSSGQGETRQFGTSAGGHVQSQILTTSGRSPLETVHEEQVVVREVTLRNGDGDQQVVEQNRHFRIPANHKVTTGLQQANDYTVHTRTWTDHQNIDQLVLAPGVLSGRKSMYNGSYIYRPFSESIY